MALNITYRLASGVSSLTKAYDTYDTRQASSKLSSMVFKYNEFEDITLTAVGNVFEVSKVQITVGDKVFWEKKILNDYNQNITGYTRIRDGLSLTLSVSSTAQLVNGYNFEIKKDYDLTFDTAGSKAILIKVFDRNNSVVSTYNVASAVFNAPTLSLRQVALNPTNLAYEVGDTPSQNDYIVTGRYFYKIASSYGKSETIPSEALSVRFGTEVAGRLNNVIITYQGSSITVRVPIVISIFTLNQQITKTSFRDIDEFSGYPTTAKVVKYYYDDNNNPVLYSQSDDDYNLIATGYSQEQGQHTITLSANGTSATYNYTINVYLPTSLTLSGYTTQYNIDTSDFDFDGTIKANYPSSLAQATLSKTDCEISTPTKEVGAQTFSVSYKGVIATGNITYNEYENLVLSFDGYLAYLKGDEFEDKLVGATIKKNGTTIELTASVITLETDTSHILDEEGEKTLTYSYEGVTAEAKIHVYEGEIPEVGEVIGADLTTSKTVYLVGESLDLNTISGYVYRFGSEERYEFTAADVLDTTALDTSTVGQNKTLVIKFVGGFEYTMPLSFVVTDIEEITITNTKQGDYHYGDQLDKTKLQFTARYYYNAKPQIDYLGTDNRVSYTFANGCSANKLIGYSNTKVLSVTASFSDINKTKTFSINVLQESGLIVYSSGKVEIEELEIANGDTFSLEGCFYKVKYNDGSLDSGYTRVDSSIFGDQLGRPVSSNTSFNTSVKKTFYNELTIESESITIYPIVYGEPQVTIGTLPSLFVGDVLGDKLTSSLVTASRTITYTKTGNVETNDIDFDDLRFSPDLSSSLKTTDTQLKVYYDNSIVLTKSITVNAVVITNVSVDTSGLVTALNSYIEGQQFSLRGIKIYVTYNNSSQPVELGVADDWSLEVEGGSLDKQNDYVKLSDNGAYLYAKVEGYEHKSIGTLTVIAKAITQIEFREGDSHKTSYFIGDFFSTLGMSLKSKFNDDSYGEVKVSDCVFSINGSVITSGSQFLPTNYSVGTYTVTITYRQTITIGYQITISAPKIKTLVANTSGIRTLYKRGETYEGDDDLSIRVTYENDYEEELSDDYWISTALDVLPLNTGKIDIAAELKVWYVPVICTNPYDSTDIKTISYGINILSNDDIVIAVGRKIEDVDTIFYIGDTFDYRNITFRTETVEGEVADYPPTSASLNVGYTFRSAQNIDVTYFYRKSDGTDSSFTTTIKILVPNKEYPTDEVTYKLAFNVSSITGESGETINFGKTYDDKGNLIREVYPLFNRDQIVIDDDETSSTYKRNIYTGTNKSADCVGYFDMGIESIKEAHMVLFKDPTNPIEGDGNIEVKYPHYVEGHADKINKCHFGIIYNNRLFVSGNESQKNFDWHTSETNNEINEFTYFSDLDYNKYGSDLTAVVGYDIYRDGDLIVYKEGSRNEATLYRRQTSLVNAMDYAGNIVQNGELSEEAYPCFPINTNGGEGALSNRTIVNFMGESLMLTNTGLKTLASNDNVSNSKKYAYDVSTYINPKITKEDLRSAFLYSFKDYVLLKVGTDVYVGYNDLRNEQNEYEWYRLTNINAELFFENDDELYFADNTGSFFKFDFDYIDKPRNFIALGGTQIDEINDRLIVNVAYQDYVIEGRGFNLLNASNEYVHASLGVFLDKTIMETYLRTLPEGFNASNYNGVIDHDTNELVVVAYNNDGTIDYDRQNEINRLFYEGRVIYLDNISGSSPKVSVATKYTLKASEEFDKYKLVNVVNNYEDEAELTDLYQFRTSAIVDDNESVEISDVEFDETLGTKVFKLKGDHGLYVDLIKYNSSDIDPNMIFKGAVTDRQNVEAFYVTTPYYMGSMANSKTIWGWSIVNDTNLASKIEVGYLSSRKSSMVGFQLIGSQSLNNNAFNFKTVQFSSDGLPRVYTIYDVIPNFSVVRYVFKNFDKENIALTSMSIVYSIGMLLKGVR